MTCTVQGCAKPSEKRTWCSAHYSRWRKTGDVQAHIPLRARHDVQLQLLSKIRKDPATGHWFWIGRINHQTGYGMVNIAGRPTGAHRAVYEHLIGPIPEGHEPDHVCRVRHCVNVTSLDHIEIVTRSINMIRAKAANRVERCKRGHLFDEANTYTRPDGGRTCRTCKNAATRASYRQNRETAA